MIKHSNRRKTPNAKKKANALKPKQVKNLAYTCEINAFYTKRIKLNFMCNTVLKRQSRLSGFKKSLYNRILLRNHRLEPNYNRRKHSISHYMVIHNQYRKLGKTFGYLSMHLIDFFIASALKNSYDFRFNNLAYRTVPVLVSLIESESSHILYRNLTFSLAQTKLSLRHRLEQRPNLKHFLTDYAKHARVYNEKHLIFNYQPKFQKHLIKINAKWLNFGQTLTY